MNEVVYTRAGRSVSEDAVSAFEMWLGTTLPEGYRVFVKGVNGAAPRPQYFSGIGATEDILELEFLFGLEREVDSENLRARVAWYPRMVWSGMLPIGVDSGGGVFGIGMLSTNRGQVFHSDELASGGVIRHVSRSFEEMIRALRSL